MEGFREALLLSDQHKCKAKEAVTGGKMPVDERKHRIVRECFEMLAQVARFSVPTVTLQLRGIELVGDIMAEFRDYSGALVYYFKGVQTL